MVVGGSDAPVERGAPLIEFYAAVARKDLAGFSDADWHPEEKLTRAEALKLFTASAAYARFAEKDLGTISVGKRADLSGFSVDLMTAPEAEIPKGHAVLTVVDGQVVYDTDRRIRSSRSAPGRAGIVSYQSSPSAMSARPPDIFSPKAVVTTLPLSTSGAGGPCRRRPSRPAPAPDVVAVGDVGEMAGHLLAERGVHDRALVLLVRLGLVLGSSGASAMGCS